MINFYNPGDPALDWFTISQSRKPDPFGNRYGYVENPDAASGGPAGWFVEDRFVNPDSTRTRPGRKGGTTLGNFERERVTIDLLDPSRISGVNRDSSYLAYSMIAESRALPIGQVAHEAFDTNIDARDRFRFENNNYFHSAQFNRGFIDTFAIYDLFMEELGLTDVNGQISSDL